MFNRLLDPEGSKLPRRCDLGPEIGIGQGMAHSGWTTTRAGRAALAAGDVERRAAAALPA